ncbi:MAG: glycosyltransferase [Bryobacteraceae bacterium]|nr:glycosyltransferase [Bryobacteraceae bacterium]MDW8379012.1 glycosyltransferase [Bryobacterales bacterium]
MTWLLGVACAIAATYQLMAVIAVLRHLFAKPFPLTQTPGVSILKPVRGDDPGFAQAIESHARLDYPDFELLFGVNHPEDPAPALIQDLARRYPQRRIEIEQVQTSSPNGKVGLLSALSALATKPVWVVNDGDIQVPAGYLKQVVAPLEDPGVCLVTCLYRVNARGLAACWEAFGISTDFAPSTLVAPLVGVKEFGLGSTLCFRAADWEAAGGFRAIENYLADDYQLAKRLTRRLGQRVVVSKQVVETNMAYRSWAEMWRHQLRWARTIRVSRPDGYLGLPVTHAGFWALLALGSGMWQVSVVVLLIRMLMGFLSSWLLLRSQQAWAFPLAPLWDVFAFAIWIAGWMGDTVEWRGNRYQLSRDGQLSRLD